VRRLGRGPLADVVTVLATFAVAGGVCGVLWWLLVDPAEYTRVLGGGATMREVELSKRFNADGWYSVLAIVAGFLTGLGVTWWRSRDPWFTTLLLLPGAALAAAVMATVGHALGPDHPDVALAGVARGQSVPVELVVTATAGYLMWPVAVLIGALMVLWSSTGVPGQDQPPLAADEPAPRAAADEHERTNPLTP
jgi:hypothetical protein